MHIDLRAPMKNESAPQEEMPMPAEAMQQGSDGIYLLVSVRPGSKIAGFRGYHGNTIRIAIKEPPEAGKANLGLELFLAQTLGLSPNQVRISSGHTARTKRVLLQGSPEVLMARVKRMCSSYDRGN